MRSLVALLCRTLVVMLFVPWCVTGQNRAGWWMKEPVRLVQTNLRETDARLEPVRLAEQLQELKANTLLFGLGGLVSFYHPQVAYQYPSPHLPPGYDLFGTMLREAHRRGIRVIGRFDFSKTRKEVYEAHPEWFFRKADGRPLIFHETYTTCINGGYYREHAPKILREALDRYAVDGLFFNQFGNQRTDYNDGSRLGPCRCDNCQARFRARYHRPLPETPTPEYQTFMNECAGEVAATFAALIHERRPEAVFMTYVPEQTDAVTSESNTDLNRPLWPYSASENVNLILNSYPGKMAFNISIPYLSLSYRFVHVPEAEVRARLFQSLAQGAGLSFAVTGTLDQEDRRAVNAARLVYDWHARHEDLYVGQESAARVLLLNERKHHSDRGSNAYRGFYRALSELHVPFAVSENMSWLKDRREAYDLVIAPDGVSAELEEYVRRGGRVLATGSDPRALKLPPVVRLWKETNTAYMRVRDQRFFPSLEGTNLLFLRGEYLEFESQGAPLLSLVPPSLPGPVERAFTDKVETNKPGLFFSDYGRGKVAYVPWDVAGLYFQYSVRSHRDLLADLIGHLLPAGPQLQTDAHPAVEITVMRQPLRRRTLVHLVNLSGHFMSAHFQPIEMRDITLELAGNYRRAVDVSTGQSLSLGRHGRAVRFVLPRLAEYGLVVLE